MENTSLKRDMKQGIEEKCEAIADLGPDAGGLFSNLSHRLLGYGYEIR